MAEPLKNLFNAAVYENFSTAMIQIKPGFEKEAFIKRIFDDNWEQLELKQRARHTSHVLNGFLSGNFKNDVHLLIKVIDFIQKKEQMKPGIESMFVPDYVEVYGLDDPQTSLEAMERITCFFSCEFAIRPFILQYPEMTLQQMQKWTKHPQPEVRRLASEGCRPRLPWAMAIPFLKKDPSPILPILEHLKNDTSETVRKSVANSLNDISKDNPEIAISLFKKWKGTSENTNWVIKHAARTLLKQGYPAVLSTFGYGSTENLEITHFQVHTPEVLFGNSLEFSFQITNNDSQSLLVRMEYGMYYLKANGKQNKKVFKISERTFDAGESTKMIRKQSFVPISTRKYYAGPHRVSIIINGKETEPLDFNLNMD